MSSPYLIIPLSVLFILIYLICLMLVRLDVIPLNQHRRFWNFLLLITFLITATLGLLIAIQINYKLEWPLVKTLLGWHVNFGISMSLVAIFHLMWHLRYYSNIFKKEARQNDIGLKSASEMDFSPKKLKYLVMLLGLTSIAIQVLLIREISTVFEGNELMLGWTLGTWMLLTGVGVLLGRKGNNVSNPTILIVNILLTISILPIVLVVLLGLIKVQLFPPGVLVNPLYFIAIVLIILSPICLLVGYSFSIFIKIYDGMGFDFSRVYALECIGSLAGGLIVSFVLIGWLSVLQSLSAIAFITSAVIFMINRGKHYLIYLLLTTSVFLLFILFPIDRFIKNPLFPNQHIVEAKETRYGNLTVTETAGQYNFFGSGSLLFTTENTIENEENVHYAMLQHKNPKNILLVSGGISGMIDEILKYPSVLSIDYVEINPDLIQMGCKYKQIPNSSKINIFAMDGKRYIYMTNKRYDVAILAIPDPSSIQINRLYTREFINVLKSKLKADGVIIYSLTSSGNYISTNKANIVSSVYHTLKENFRYVDIIPGDKDYFVASDSTLNPGVAGLTAVRGVENKYVNQFYIDDYTNLQRSDYIKNSIGNYKLINSDSKPLPVFYEYLQFISLFSGKGKIWILVPIIVLLIPVFLYSKVSKNIYIAGFSSSAIELLIIFSFQVVYGYAYSAIGMIIAVFMAGLALGAIIANKFNNPKKYFLFAQLSLGIFFLIYPVVNGILDCISSSTLIYFIFITLTIIPSILVGYIYVSGTRLFSGEITRSATINYSADLIGSALGITALTIILLPVLGVVYSCFVIAGLNLLGALLTLNGLRNTFNA